MEEDARGYPFFFLLHQNTLQHIQLWHRFYYFSLKSRMKQENNGMDILNLQKSCFPWILTGNPFWSATFTSFTPTPSNFMLSSPNLVDATIPVLVNCHSGVLPANHLCRRTGDLDLDLLPLHKSKNSRSTRQHDKENIKEPDKFTWVAYSYMVMGDCLKNINHNHEKLNGNKPGSIKRRVGRMPALRMLAMRRPRNLSKNETTVLTWWVKGIQSLGQKLNLVQSQNSIRSSPSLYIFFCFLLIE